MKRPKKKVLIGRGLLVGVEVDVDSTTAHSSPYRNGLSFGLSGGSIPRLIQRSGLKSMPPGLLAPPGAFGRWKGGIGRRGHRGWLKSSLTEVMVDMEWPRSKEVVREFVADAAGRENVLTGLRKAGVTSLRADSIDDTRISFSFHEKQPQSITLRRLENVLSEIRKEQKQ